jgi:uncharacterized protein (UPF0332 family)
MTHEQAALIEKAKSSLDAAKLLLDKGFVDFAISRAYYSMFYTCEALLLGKGLSFSKHSAVIAAFGQHFVKTGLIPEEYHRYLIEGQDSRNVGDYDMDPGLTVADASEQLRRAEAFLDAVEKII